LVGLGTVACDARLGGWANGQAGDGDGDRGLTSLESSEDPGFKGIHRLNSREYDRTVRDLLGTTLRPGSSFLNETAHGFDNVAATLGMTSGQYAAYFRAAKDIAAEVIGSAELSSNVLVCNEPGAACAEDIIGTF